MSANGRVVLVLVLILVAAGVGGYLVLTTNPAPPEKPIERPEPTEVAAAPVPEGRPGGLAGEVRVYRTNEPAAGLTVRIEGARKPVERTTDANGRFAAVVPSGPALTVTIVAPEPYADIVLKGLSVPPDKTVSLGTLYLEKGLLVRGIVVTQSGTPVAGATVGAYRPTFGDAPGRNFLDFFRTVEKKRVPLEEVKTDREGAFTLSHLSPGTYRIEAQAEGYAVGVKTRAIVSPESANLVHRIVLWPGVALEGRVTNLDDVPVPEATVSVLRTNQRSFSEFEFHTVQEKTDEKGRFSFTNLLPGQAMVSVAAEGYPTKIENTVMVGQQRELVIRIGGTAALAGRVTDGKGEPVAGASVVAAVGQRGGAFVQTETDTDGRYLVERLPSGRIQLFLVRAAGYASYPPMNDLRAMQRGMGELEEGQTLTKDVTLRKGARVTGRITSRADGHAIAGARVDILSAAGMFFLGADATAFTDEDGSYALEGVGHGTYVLMVKAPGYYLPDLSPQLLEGIGMGMGSPPPKDAADSPLVSIKEGETEKRKDIALYVGATASGTVLTPDGRPVPGARVTITTPQGNPFLAATGLNQGKGPAVLADAEGNFRMTGLAAGSKLRFQAEAQDWVEGLSEEVTLEAGGEISGITIRLRRGGRLSGTVTGSDGVPVAGAEVRALKEPENNPNPWSTSWQLERVDPVVTDATGKFLLDGLSPGRYHLRFRGRGYQTVDRQGVAVPEGGDGGPLSVELPKGLSITGAVTDEQGSPISSAFLWITPNSRPGEVVTMPYRNLTTKEDGSFELEGLSPGDYSLTFNAQGYARKTLAKVSAGTQDLRVVLEKGLAISGRVLLPDGGPAAGIWVNARDGDNQNGSDRTNEEGRFRIENLPPGTYTLTANAGGGMVFAGGATDQGPDVRTTSMEGVAAGSRDIQIRLRQGASISGVVTDPAGNPVEGASLWATEKSPQAGRQVSSGWARTDAEGRFRIRGLDPALVYTVRANLQGYASGESVETDGGAAGVVLRLGPRQEKPPRPARPLEGPRPVRPR